ncbi:MAG: Crp/Fnr family transcriptional regulator [Paracoccaceae bacterium]|jgi:CRP/FNR family transcriptional regulator, cyclic AMP receptor protein|nr:Crp/Fnr family transcriptional regulator [Paracoccaceae bacterium]
MAIADLSQNWPYGSLLGGLSVAARKALSDKWMTEQFDAGRLIFGDKDPSRDVFFVISGSARAAAFTLSGREVSFNVIGPGDCFGEIAAIDGGIRSSSVAAVKSVTVGRLSASDFQQILETEAEIARAFFTLLCGKVRGMSDKLVEYTELTSAQRVRRELTRLARAARVGADSALITEMPTQAELATRILARREAVTREFAHLQCQGFVERRKDGFHVPSIRHLEAEILL